MHYFNPYEEPELGFRIMRNLWRQGFAFEASFWCNFLDAICLSGYLEKSAILPGVAY